MLRWFIIVLALGLISACTDRASAPEAQVQALGARSADYFFYENEDGEAVPALLAGVRAAPGEAGRDVLDQLLDTAGPRLTLSVSEAGADRYGRDRVYARFEADSGSVSLNETLVATGYALVWPAKGATAEADVLFEAEQRARSVNAGLWGEGVFVIRDPDPDRLAQVLDSPQIIEGRVVAVGEARNGRLFLNFGLNWQTDFTVSLTRDDREAFEPSGSVDPATLEGAVIRVRGWLYEENGPMIQVSHPLQIEILDAPEAPAWP